MASFTPHQYDVIERAVANGQRLLLTRRGVQFILLPERLVTSSTEERLEGRHPSTGEPISFVIGELERVDLLR